MKIIQIVGFGRSGSTLLSQLIASRLDALDVGELRFFFERGVRKNERCSCGEYFHDCPFWSDVLANFDSNYTNHSSYNKIEKLYSSSQRLRALFPVLLSNKKTSNFGFIESALIKSIRDTLPSNSTLVDSSKIPVRSYLYSRLLYQPLSVYIIHLIRDPRAVSHSWTKNVLRPETDNKESMAKFSVLKSSILWLSVNIVSFGLKLIYKKRYIKVVYQDLCGAPDTVIDSILAKFELKGGGNETAAPISHSISGNPLRFSEKKTSVKSDEAWKKSMNPARKLLSTILCFWLYRFIR